VPVVGREVARWLQVLKVNGREIHRCEILSLLPRSMADSA